MIHDSAERVGERRVFAGKIQYRFDDGLAAEACYL